MKILLAVSTILLLIQLISAAPSSNDTGRDASSPEQHEVTVMADGDEEVLSDDILSNEIPRTLDNDPAPKTADRSSFFKFAKPSSFMDDLAAATPYASTTPSSDEATSTTTTVSSTPAAETTTSSPTTAQTTELPALDDLSDGFGKLIDSLFRSALASIFHLPTGMMDSNSRSLPPTHSHFNSHFHHFSSPSTRHFFHFGRSFWVK